MRLQRSVSLARKPWALFAATCLLGRALLRSCQLLHRSTQRVLYRAAGSLRWRKFINVKKDGTRGRYVHSELIHSRFAMAGVAGILIPDVLTHAGLLNVPVWYEQGLVAQQGSFAPFSASSLPATLFRSFRAP